MSPRQTITVNPGDRFGRLTVLREGRQPQPRPDRASSTERVVWCLCDCGKETCKRLRNVVNGITTSCGCVQDETRREHARQVGLRNVPRLIDQNRSPESRERSRKFWRSSEGLRLLARLPESSRVHGLRRHPLYGTWRMMLDRCENPSNKAYRYYGGRGVAVCPQWRDVTTFITWIDANLGLRPEGRTLDRIKNDGNYEPGNVRWATAKEQNANRRVPDVPRT